MEAEFSKPGKIRFDHEKLDVYQLSLRFLAWVAELLAEVKGQSNRSTAEVRGHLDCAALSILLNIAEGNAKRQAALRARFLDDSRGSAAECAACLDSLVAMGACLAARVDEGKDILVRIVSMLTRMIDRLDERVAAHGSPAAAMNTRARVRERIRVREREDGPER